jgi:hypothetical protein
MSVPLSVCEYVDERGYSMDNGHKGKMNLLVEYI